MKPILSLLLVGMLPSTQTGQAGSPQNNPPGVPSPQLAEFDYKLKCQGCHRKDGSGDDHTNPPMNGAVAKFLQVEGGREFLIQVPGVATADLDSERLAALVNWTLYRFAPLHLPEGFQPYAASEVESLRQNPLRLERAAKREQLMIAINKLK